MTSEAKYVHADGVLAEMMCNVRLIGLDYPRAVELLRFHAECVPDECDVFLACATHIADWLDGE